MARRSQRHDHCLRRSQRRALVLTRARASEIFQANGEKWWAQQRRARDAIAGIRQRTQA